jgi:hypothetical protein
VADSSGLEQWRARQRRGGLPEIEGADRFKDPAALSLDATNYPFLLDGKKLDANLAKIITGGRVASTIEGASTLDLNFRDRDRWLLRSRLLRNPVVMWAIGLDWSFAGMEYSTAFGDGTLRFEDLIVAEARRHNKPRKVARDQVTRARFGKMLVDELPAELGVIYVCPEIDKPQPIGKSRADRDADRMRGIPSGAKLKIRGADATGAQLAICEQILDRIENFDAADRVLMVAGMMIVINETGARNLPGSSDGLSRGAMQLRSDYAAKWGVDNMDVDEVTRWWLTQGAPSYPVGAIEWHHDHPDDTPAEIARRTWGGTGFDVSTWTRWADEANAIVDAYGGHSSDRERSGGETARYEFSRGRPQGPRGEDTWEATGRMADEVGWRRFVVRKRWYYMSEEDLILSRPRATIELDTPGIDDVHFDVDGRQRVNELRIDCRAGLWKAPPGSVILLSDEFGLAEGRWLVSEAERDDLFGLDMTIECRREAALLKEKAEPAPEAVSTSISIGGSVGGGRSATARAINEACNKIDRQRRGYDYGGGHGPALSSLVSGGDLDCSSATSLALWMAGEFPDDVAWVSGDFARRYGNPGPGEFVTIYAHDGHVYIEGRLPDLGYWRFDTSQNGSSGPRLVTFDRSDAGFTARHPA